MICITESWLTSDITNSMISINGYYVDPDLRTDKLLSNNGIGSGIVIYVRNGLKVFKVDDPNTFNQYCRFYIVNDDSEKLYFSVVYRSPNSSTINNDKLASLISDLDYVNENHIILGDFNYPNIDWENLSCDAKARTFIDACSDNGLTQVVDFPTHCRGNTLDIFLTNKPDSFISVECIGNLHNSDHVLILADYDFSTQKSDTEQLMPDWRNLNKEGFEEYLTNIDWNQVISSENVETSWTKFKTVLEEGCERFLPKKPRRQRGKPIWMNDNVTRLIRIKQRRFKAHNRIRNQESLANYKESEKKCKKAVRNARKQFEKKVSQNKNDKQFYSYVNSKTKNVSNVGPLKVNNTLITNESEMAETLNDFFASVFTQEDISNIPTIDPLDFREALSTTQITEQLVMEKLNGLKDKNSTGPDGLSTKLFKLFKNHLCYPLTKLFQNSLISGIVPEDWRTANVTPVFKKGGKGNPGNYRPISLTSIPCKIMELLLKDAIVKHLNENNLIKESQHGFMKNKSCTTNLLEFLEVLTKALDSGDCFDVIYLDFSKAFDKVPKLRLIETLKAHGISGEILIWLSSWLSDRKQRVVLNGKCSSWKLVLSGVPQGSILGPLLFLIFINCLDDTANLITILRKFADDSKVGQVIRSDEDRNKLQDCLNSLFDWTQQMGMEFNIGKCHVLHFGHRNPNYSYSISNQNLESAGEERDIGVIISNTLKPSSHCASIVKKANFALMQLLRCFLYRDKTVFLNLYKQRVRPILEFCSSVWNPWLTGDIESLEKVQKKAIRNITGLKGKTYEEKLKELNILSLKDRRLKTDLIQVFKILNKKDDVDPSNWFQTYDENGRTTRLANCRQNLKKARCRLDIRKYFFSQRVIDDWNALPTDVKTQTTVNGFKKRLDAELKSRQ